MIKLILSGASGQMGRVIARCVGSRNDCTVVAGIDRVSTMSEGFHIFASAAECTVPADVIIDFSHPSALESLLQMAQQRGIGVVISTTGLSQDQVALIHQAANKIPVFYSANMSLGVSLMLELAKTAARVLGHDFDIEIIEKHHNQKIDAPSGTALMLADGIAQVLDESPQYVYDRHSQRKKRTKNEIGLHAVRGGSIVGEHDILFAGRDEQLIIRHVASSKEIFATGSINAALFLAGKAPGLYTMKDLI